MHYRSNSTNSIDRLINYKFNFLLEHNFIMSKGLSWCRETTQKRRDEDSGDANWTPGIYSHATGDAQSKDHSSRENGVAGCTDKWINQRKKAHEKLFWSWPVGHAIGREGRWRCYERGVRTWAPSENAKRGTSEISLYGDASAITEYKPNQRRLTQWKWVLQS